MKKKKAFTLVELLAVVVILAVILVIAIPQIIKVITQAKLSSMKDSAILIATNAEKDYLANQVLNPEYRVESILCDDVAKLNDDYQNCEIEYNENGKAMVELFGKNKFYGIICRGSKDDMICKDNAFVSFQYTGNVQNYKVPYTGYYKLEVWGAKGGTGYRNANAQSGGNGGKTEGIIYLTEGTKLYTYVGGVGGNGSTKVGGSGGYNGGAKGGNDSNGDAQYDTAGGGGGATDIRVNGTSLTDRIIVAAGGGGGSYNSAGGLGNLHSGSNYSSGNLGIGQTGYTTTAAGGGGGGGYYGGKSDQTGGAMGYGGTNYVSDNFTNVIINVANNDGAGRAQITYLGETLFEEKKSKTFTSIGYHNYKVPETGYYKIELWGAEGGSGLANGKKGGLGGKGAYTSGYIYLEKNDLLNVLVGGKGEDGINKIIKSFGGFNGGASGLWDDHDDEATGGGGGATDVRFGTNYNDYNVEASLNSRIMVAAGGGGDAWTHQGKDGGTLLGISPSNNTPRGTQTTGYAFGLGGAGVMNYLTPGGGGGSGYYGGYGGQSEAVSGASGSSFISGYAGVNAITSESDRTHTDGTIHYSGKYFIGGKMQSGVNTGDGKATITYIGNEKPERINENLNNVKYIKDCINGNTVNSFNHWVELQAIKDGVNVAKEKTVTGTVPESTNPETGYRFLVDGKIDNITGNSGYASPSSQGNQCLTVDLGEIYDLDEIVVWHYFEDTRTYNDNVTYVSNDNHNWIQVINKQENETSNGKRVSAYE